uniref:Putative secreted protein n=1 Tax=Anopheles triannulatus TaxID=58253 RepID=A0A2M4B2Z7_9DIPT
MLSQLVTIFLWCALRCRHQADRCWMLSCVSFRSRSFCSKAATSNSPDTTAALRPPTVVVVVVVFVDIVFVYQPCKLASHQQRRCRRSSPIRGTTVSVKPANDLRFHCTHIHTYAQTHAGTPDQVGTFVIEKLVLNQTHADGSEAHQLPPGEDTSAAATLLKNTKKPLYVQKPNLCAVSTARTISLLGVSRDRRDSGQCTNRTFFPPF